MIGQWDDDQCVLAYTPYAYSRGNGKTSFNVGIFPTFPGGAFQPSTLTNMAAGYGYVNTGILRFQGDDDQVTSQYDFAPTDASNFTIELKFDYDGVANNQIILSQWDNDTNYMMAAIRDSKKIQLLFRKGAAIDLATSTDVISAGNNTLDFRKAGAILTLWINGLEVAAYDTQDPYALGILNIVAKTIIGIRGVAFPLSSSIQHLAIFTKALSNTTIAAHAALDEGMGLIGTATGGSMALAVPSSGRINKSSLNTGINMSM